MRYLAEFAAGTVGAAFYYYTVAIGYILRYLGLNEKWCINIALASFVILVLGGVVTSVHYYRKKRYYLGTLFLIIAVYIVFGVVSFGYFSMNK